MLDSIYIGMSGLTSFAKGLTNISNNVANLNTTGFKGSELDFADLFYQYQYSGSGSQDGSASAQGGGVKAASTHINFAQGDFRQTGGDLDVAITGNGFFIVNKDGKTTYTRAGQFTVDQSGFLTTQDDGSHVSGINNGQLIDINISGLRSNPPVATSTIKFTNSLSSTSTTYEVTNITAIDSLGTQHTFKMELTNDSANTAGRWTFQLLEGTNVLTNGEVRYDGSGTPTAGFDTYSFNYAPGAGANSSNLTLDFTGTNFFSSSASSLSFASQDGRSAGFLSKTAIDADGFVVLTYSNGQTAKAGQVALASFSNISALEAQGSNRYNVFGKTDLTIGAPNQKGLGTLQTGGIELSNVDLAKEFSELIIVQRGYQASSQVITAANEMIQQLDQIQGRK